MVEKMEYDDENARASLVTLLHTASETSKGKESKLILDCMRSVIMGDVSYLNTARENINDGFVTVLDIFALGYHGQTVQDVGLLANVIYGHPDIDEVLAEQAIYSLRSMLSCQEEVVVNTVNSLSSFIWDHQQRGICWRVLAETYSLLPKDSLNLDVVYSAYSTFERLPRNSKTGLSALKFLYLIPHFTEHESLSEYLAQKYEIASPSQKIAIHKAMIAGMVVPSSWVERLDAAWDESHGDEITRDDIAELASMVSASEPLLELLFTKILKGRQHSEWTDRERRLVYESGLKRYEGIFIALMGEFESMSDENRLTYIKGLSVIMKGKYEYAV